MRTLRHIRNLARQIAGGGLSTVQSDAKRWLYSDIEAIGFRRDYQRPCPPPPSAGVELTALPLDEPLASKLFEDGTVEGRDLLYLSRRRSMWEHGFLGGYVAVDPDGEPVFLQFYIPHSQQPLVREYWGPLFPELGPDSFLVEGAWVPPRYRRRGIMASAMHAVSEAAKADGPDSVRYGVTFAEVANRGATFGCRDAGFDIFQRRVETWRFGRLSVRFEQAIEADYPHLDRQIETR